MKNKIIILLISLFISFNLTSIVSANELAPGGIDRESARYDEAIEKVMDTVLWVESSKDYYYEYYSPEEFNKYKEENLKTASEEIGVPYPDFYNYISLKFKNAEQNGNTKELNKIETKHYVNLKDYGLYYEPDKKNKPLNSNFEPTPNVKVKEDKTNQVVNKAQIKLNRENSQWITFIGVFVITVLILFLKYIKDNFLGL